jgi:hypothetical protein
MSQTLEQTPKVTSRRNFWQLPSIMVMRLTIDSYLRSNWYWGEVVLVLAWFAALFFPFPGTISYFFSVGGSGLYGVAILGSAALVRHSVGARSYIVLAKLSSRAAYSRGLILATLVLRVPLLIMLDGLALLLQRITNPDAGWMLVGSIGVLLNCWLAAALTVALSSPMATRLIRIIFLAILLVTFTPLEQIAEFLSLLRTPIFPVAICFAMGTNGQLDWLGLIAIIMQFGYLAGIIWLAGFWLERRELLLQ